MQVYECIIALIAGVGVFILAMKMMSDSLTQIAGDRMKNLLEKLAGNRFKGVLVGALVTAVIQSSSATTVMVIGFVNAEVMTLNQAAAIIIGSNIGTTVTGLLASLESLNISLYLSLLVFIGVMLAFVKKLKKIANLMAGLGMIFVGLKLMSGACDDQSIRDAFSNVLAKLEFPLLLEFLGVIFTAIIQSSSAMTGIVIVMVGKEVMTMKNGLFITLGANVGTCVTALIGIIGANTNSKRTALIHFIFNVSGCILFTPILWIFSDFIVELLEKISSDDSRRIAYFHLVFNITTACITTPLIKYLVKFVIFAVKYSEPPKEYLEWFIKDKEPLLDMRPSSTSLNINTNDYISEDNALLSSKQSDDIIIKDVHDVNEGLFRKDSGSDNLSDNENEINKNKKKKKKEEKLEVKKEEKIDEEDKKEEKKEEDKKEEIKEEKKEEKIEEDKKEEEKKEEEKKDEEKKEEEKKDNDNNQNN